MNERTSLPVHGGNLDAIARSRGTTPDTLLDFSANINPLGPPAALLAALRDAANDGKNLTHYPEPTYRVLREAIAAAHTLDPEAIVIGNGGAALLDAAIATFGVRRALVPTPAFSEYRRALESRAAVFIAAPLDRKRDFAIDATSLIKRARSAAADTAIVNSPHNPSGALLRGDAMRVLVESLSNEGRSTIVDEAFADYSEADSNISLAARSSSLVVVRSLTKFFAVPALRVGFAVTHPDVAKRMRAAMPSWPVTSLAARAIAAALNDTAYAERTRFENERSREQLRVDLGAIGMRTLPSVANFLLVEVPVPMSAATLTKRVLEDYAIVLRDCTSYDDLDDGRFVRIAVRNPADNARLVAALASIHTAGEGVCAGDSSKR